MQTQTVAQPVTQASNYVAIAPLMAAMHAQVDQEPKNALPQDTNGTIQSHAHSVPSVTLYNAHGLLTKTNANTLIAYA